MNNYPTLEKPLSEQQGLVLNYMLTHPFITSYDSIVGLGVLDLRKRISELRKLGFPIDDRTITAKNRYGKTVSHKEYFLTE